MGSSNLSYFVSGSDVSEDGRAYDKVVPSGWYLNTHRFGDGWLDVHPGTQRPNISCHFHVHVKRSPTMYNMKSTVVDILVITCAFLALFLNPAVPPLLGGRFGILITGILIHVNKFSSWVSPVGVTTYPIFVDAFALINIAFITVALMVTAFVGFCHRQGLPSRAIAVDRFVRCYTFISYYGCVIGIYVNLEEQDPSKSFIFFAFQAPLAFVVLIFIELSQLDKKRRIRSLMNKLGELHSLSGIEARSLVWQLIRTWNKREIDALDKIQLRYILHIFHPGVSHDKAIIAIDHDPTGTMYNADKILKLLQIKVDGRSLSTITGSALELTSRQVKAEPKVEAKEEAKEEAQAEAKAEAKEEAKAEAKEETKEEMPQVVVRTENGSTEMHSRHDAEDAVFNAPAAAKSVQTADPQAQRTASLSLRCARRGSQQVKGYDL